MPSFRIFKSTTLPDADRAVASGSTYYSDKFQLRGKPVSLHIFADDAGATLAGTTTLWLSNKTNPSTANDNDWVQETWTAPTIAGGDVKFFSHLVDKVALHARLKFVCSAGAGTLGCDVNASEG